jgi:hypothetical protein
MWNKMRVLLVSGVVLTSTVWAGETVPNGDVVDPFHGEWVMQATPDDLTASEGNSAFSEAVLFHNGEFSAAAFAMFGFSPAGYTVAAKEDGSVVFTATLTSTDRGTLTWTGHESPGGLTGKLEWVRPEGVTYRYEVLGVRPDPG